MKTNRVLLFYGFLTLTLISIVKADDFSETYFPKGVRLGINLVAVKALKPDLTQNNLLSTEGKTGEVNTEFIELQKPSSPPLAYCYRFKNDKLGAITRSIFVRGIPNQDLKLAASKIYRDLRANFRKIREEKAVRSAGGANNIITMQVWQGDDTHFSVYFAATTDELTLIMYDPTQFDKTNFFLGPERLADLDARTNQIKKLPVGETKKSHSALVDLIPDIQP